MQRLLQVTLALIAVAFAAIGAYFLLFGFLERSYDSTIWQYVALGLTFMLMAIGLLIAIRHNRALQRARESSWVDSDR